MRNATYIRPRTRNQLIEVIVTHVNLHGVLDEKKQQKSSLLPDEVTSHSAEHLAMCVRFVDRKKEARKEFLNLIHKAGNPIEKAHLATLG